METLHAQLREREEQTELYKRKYARAKKQNMALLQQMQQYDEYVQQVRFFIVCVPPADLPHQKINKQKQQLQQDVQRLQTADTEKQSEARTKSDLVASLEAVRARAMHAYNVGIYLCRRRSSHSRWSYSSAIGR